MAYREVRKLDITKAPGRMAVVEPIYLRQGETGETEIVGEFYYKGKPYNVADCTPRFRATNAEKHTVDKICELEGDSAAKWLVDEDLTIAAGLVAVAYFEMRKDGVRFDSSAIPIIVLPGAQPSSVEEHQYSNEIDKWLGNLEEWLAKAMAQEASRVTEEDARVDAESKRVAAEESRVEAENARDEAEGIRRNAELARIGAENQRKTDELARRSAEVNRKQSESVRVENEDARKLAESGRIQAEQERDEAETARDEAEQKRNSAETVRDEAEQKRIEAEDARDAAETVRAENEEQRVSAETDRLAAETTRSRAEDQRKANEIERQKAEMQRRSNMTQVMQSETERREAEIQRELRQAKNDADQANNNLAAQGRLTRILKPGEYDPDSREPIIEGDLTHVFAVPTKEAETAAEELEQAKAEADAAKQALDQIKHQLSDAAGEGPQFDGQLTGAQSTLDKANTALELAEAKYEAANRYVEWLWLIDDETGEGYWELYGSGNSTLPDPITTDEYDRMWAGETVESKHVSYAQGESYNVAKAKAAISDLQGIVNKNATDQATKDDEQDKAIEAAATAASTALSDAVKVQATKDEDQDKAIKAAQQAAEEAAKAIPPVVTKSAPGIMPPLPEDASRDKLYAAGADEEDNAIWVEVKTTGGAADPRELRATIASATKIHDEAFSDDQGDPQIGAWKNTPEAIAALQTAIDAAKKVSDGFGTEVFLQEELDNANRALLQAIEQFKSTGTEVKPDLSAFEALKDRIDAVNDEATASADGKDITFGEQYVLQSDKATIDTALQVAQKAVTEATRQSQIDAACATLASAVSKYESAVKVAAADTAALDAAISAAETAKDGVAVSEDGSELPAGSRYVTDQAILDAINTAVETASTTRDSATTQKQLDDATSALTQATKEFSAQVKQNISIYGVRFDNFPTVTKGTRTDGAANFGDVQPAVSNGSGSSPFDNIDPWMSMVPEDRVGGRMVPIKKFWYKLAQDGKGVDIQISTGPMEGFELSPAHRDRNDGKGERDVIYVGRYHCATGTYHSTTKVMPANNANKATMYQNCKNVGDGYYMMDFATRFTLWLLYLVEMASWNSQADIGFGTGNGSSPENMGYTDSMQYCTGTTQADRTTQAIGTQWRNIEGLWDNVLDFMSGCYNDGNGFNIILDAAKLGDSTGGKSVGTPQASGFVGELKVSNTAGFPLFYGSNSSGGSETVGTCDHWNWGSSNPVVYVGGNYGRGTSFGMFYVYRNSATNSNANLGCRPLLDKS